MSSAFSHLKEPLGTLRMTVQQVKNNVENYVTMDIIWEKETKKEKKKKSLNLS